MCFVNVLVFVCWCFMGWWKLLWVLLVIVLVINDVGCWLVGWGFVMKWRFVMIIIVCFWLVRLVKFVLKVYLGKLFLKSIFLIYKLLWKCWKLMVGCILVILDIVMKRIFFILLIVVVIWLNVVVRMFFVWSWKILLLCIWKFRILWLWVLKIWFVMKLLKYLWCWMKVKYWVKRNFFVFVNKIWWNLKCFFIWRLEKICYVIVWGK